MKWPSIAPVISSPALLLFSSPSSSCNAVRPPLQTGTFYNMPPQTHLLLLTDPKVSQLQLPLWVTGFARSTRTLTQVLRPDASTQGEGTQDMLVLTCNRYTNKMCTNQSAGTKAQLTVCLQVRHFSPKWQPPFVFVSLLFNLLLESARICITSMFER